MNRLASAGAAFASMLRAAIRDPLWAMLALATAPIRHAEYLVKTVIGFVVIVLITGFGLQYLLHDLAGIEKGEFLWHIGNIAFTLFVLLVLFRLISTPLINHFGYLESDTHGTARFASKSDVAALTRATAGKGLLIGRDPKSGKLIHYGGQSHLLTIAPTRTGKGVGTIIPNLLTADRSVICIDPKGENAKIARRARRAFGPVHVLDPFGVTSEPTAAFNPLDGVDSESLDVAEDASTLAEALVYDEPGMAGEAHWNEEAKALIAGILLMIVMRKTSSQRNLPTLRAYLTQPPEDFAALLRRMQEISEAEGLIARAANRHLGKSDREAAGVLSAAQRHTHFLDSPRMTRVLGRSDFCFADLKKDNGTVFLVLPPDRLSTYSRWLRLLVTQGLLDMARTMDKPGLPVLYILDEFASLGHLPAVERAMGLMAGYGVQLWPILQDIHQLRATYGQRAGTFLSNAGVLQVFGVNDNDSARLVSDLLGQETVVFQTMGRAPDVEKSGLSFSEQHVARPLLTPDEVRNLPRDAVLLFLAGQHPIIGRKLHYYRDPEFKWKFDPQ
ncbi:type IV secretion system protein VirD4 [Rhizobium tibeticum]|uniref:Conjugal transfer protein TraG n=1 Tax=Rhizobium tibeticum TaxID=501024 RepID=A0A1H8PR08_9HYPH|nr:type IV secretory system conjugative DNA transfer family protein [Rhizobium tibeticum]SEH98558.1 Conjugal transfer protein TraG [Rhizobium tibeticum]SEO43963.1 type IV secretion system protein VirD4 [Rhizobium tibeticum]